MMVGTCLAIVGSHAPPLGRPRLKSGTHDGCGGGVLPFTGSICATRNESHPHPGPAAWPPVNGLFPVNPSVVPATSSRCPPHDGESAIVNARSSTAYVPASAVRFGT